MCRIRFEKFLVSCHFSKVPTATEPNHKTHTRQEAVKAQMLGRLQLLVTYSL